MMTMMMMMIVVVVVMLQDKYILGLMVILCGVCVWHAIIGAAAMPDDGTDDHVISTEMTSRPNITSYEMTSSSPNASAESTVCPSAVGDTASSKMTEIVMADRMALAMFGSLYLLFHVVIVARICASVSSHLYYFWFTSR